VIKLPGVETPGSPQMISYEDLSLLKINNMRNLKIISVCVSDRTKSSAG
jgi:hypothetical protein